MAREAIVTEFKRVAGALQRARSIAAALKVEEEIDSLIAGVDAFRLRFEQPAPAVAQ